MHARRVLRTEYILCTVQCISRRWRSARRVPSQSLRCCRRFCCMGSPRAVSAAVHKKKTSPPTARCLRAHRYGVLVPNPRVGTCRSVPCHHDQGGIRARAQVSGAWSGPAAAVAPKTSSAVHRRALISAVAAWLVPLAPNLGVWGLCGATQSFPPGGEGLRGELKEIWKDSRPSAWEPRNRLRSWRVETGDLEAERLRPLWLQT